MRTQQPLFYLTEDPEFVVTRYDPGYAMEAMRHSLDAEVKERQRERERRTLRPILAVPMKPVAASRTTDSALLVRTSLYD